MAKALILKKLIRALNTNTVQFEKELGVGHSAIAKAIARESDISDMLINKILKRYPTISEHWLKTGEGEMYIKSTDTTINNTPMNNIEQQDWKQAHRDLMDAHKLYAQSHQVLSNALYEMTQLMKKIETVDTNLNTAIKEQLAYHAAIASEHRVLFAAMDDLRQMPAGEHAKKADIAQREHLQKILKKDNADV